MKQVFAILFGLLVLVSISANAQTPTYGAQTLSVPTIVTATATAGNGSNNLALVMDVRKQGYVGLQVRTGCTNNLLNFGASVDGITYSTNYITVGWTNAKVLYTMTTNLDCRGIGYLRLDYVEALGTIDATNQVKYGVKISSP